MSQPPAHALSRDTVLLKVSLGARVERQRHPGERRVQTEMAGGGVRALKLGQIVEDGLRQGVDELVSHVRADDQNRHHPADVTSRSNPG
jgi:hypothetical protein